jgi:hypothetical protein
MNIMGHPLHHLIFCFWLIALSITRSSAQSDAGMTKQIEDCNKNTASEWSSSLNRCVGKAEARQNRHEADACNAITDITSREACHKALAEKTSGLSSDPKSLKQGNTTGSMMMNAAYTIVSVINFTGSGASKSSCTSKTIFGVTAVAGLASDFYLKYKAKKKIKELTGKYTLDVKNGASDAQVKALEYLKEEQKTVAEIAGFEKKRNLILMLGYGAAGVMAAVELAFPAMNPECNKSDEKPKEEGKKDVAKTDTPKVEDSADGIKNDLTTEKAPSSMEPQLESLNPKVP